MAVQVITVENAPSPVVTVAIPAGVGILNLPNPHGHRLVALGDSITAADAYVKSLSVLSGGAIRVVSNAGVGGNQIDQMLARFDTDVTPYSPTMVSLMGGTNDYTFGATDAQFRSRVQQFILKVKQIGAIPLLLTSPPCNVLADPDRAKIIRNNVWMIDYAQRNGIPVVDTYSVLVDHNQDFGRYRSDLVMADGIHPSDLGHALMAEEINAALNSPMFLPPPVAVTISDPTNLLTNGFLRDANGDGWADNWGQTWGLDSGNWTYTVVSDSLFPGGTAQRVALSGATGHISRDQTITTGFTPGDQLRLTGMFNTDPGTYALMHIEVTGGSSWKNQKFDRPIRAGLIDVSFTVPAGATSLHVLLDAGAVGSGITGNVDLGAITLRNMTVLGLV